MNTRACVTGWSRGGNIAYGCARDTTTCSTIVKIKAATVRPIRRGYTGKKKKNDARPSSRFPRTNFARRDGPHAYAVRLG